MITTSKLTPHSSHLSTLTKLMMLFLALNLGLVSTLAPAQTKPSITIALLEDAKTSDEYGMRHRHIDELETLTAADFDLNFIDYKIDWSSHDYGLQLKKIYQNSEVDMLLVLGVAANQIVVKQRSFPKPTFLPLVIERELAQAPFKATVGDNGISNKKNLSYLSYSSEFVETVEKLREVVRFKNIAIIGDEVLFRVLPSALLQRIEATDELRLQIITHDGQNHNVLDRIPNDVDAVMIGYIPRYPRSMLPDLIAELTERNLPTFSYLEENLIQYGLLATPLNQSVYQFSARRNALNMQAVMLGEPASQQPVLVKTKEMLTINGSTAQKLGIAIDFKVLVDAHVVNFGVGDVADRLGLLQITERALAENLNLKDIRYSYELQENERSFAKGALLPQLSANGSYLKRKDDSILVQSGFANEQSTDANIQLSQTLFSDAKFANYTIQSFLAQASSHRYRQAQLDTIREASLAMADVLQSQSVAAIQQENLDFTEKNLELAKDRVSIGVSSSADQYRWETQVSNGKSAVFESFSNVLIAKQNLNRIINRDVAAELEVMPLDLNNSMVYSTDEIFKLMDNTDTFERMYRYGLMKSFDGTPEIQRLELIIEAKRRELKTVKRRNWLPDVSLTGQLSENFDTSSRQGNDVDGRDWQLMLNARIPFYQGGQTRSLSKRAALELAQLENQLATLKQNISQSLRSSMNTLITSLFGLEFSSNAAIAASKSLSLVTDAYSKGAVPVVDLLDAQNASISSNLAEVQASIGFFRASIEMQRAIGIFEFLMSDQQKKIIRQEIANQVGSK
jgi:outer membrane protein TolC